MHVLWAALLVCTGRSLDLLAPYPAHQPSSSKPRRAHGARKPKKCLRERRRGDKASAAKGHPLCCWRCHGFMLGSARNSSLGSGRIKWGTAALSFIQSVLLIRKHLRKITEKRSKLSNQSNEFRTILVKGHVSVRELDCIHQQHFDEIPTVEFQLHYRKIGDVRKDIIIPKAVIVSLRCSKKEYFISRIFLVNIGGRNILWNRNLWEEMYHRQLKKKSFFWKENLDSLSTEYSHNSI